MSSLWQQLDRDNFVALEIGGSSMSPTLRDGSTIIVKPTNTVKIGDVVVIESSNNLIVHRIAGEVRIGRKSWYIHIGDNSSYPGLASEDEIVGRVNGNVDFGMRNVEWRAFRNHHSSIRNPFVTLLSLFLHLGAFLVRLGLYPRNSMGNFNKTAVSTAKFLLHRAVALCRLVS